MSNTRGDDIRTPLRCCCSRVKCVLMARICPSPMHEICIVEEHSVDRQCSLGVEQLRGRRASYGEEAASSRCSCFIPVRGTYTRIKFFLAREHCLRAAPMTKLASSSASLGVVRCSNMLYLKLSSGRKSLSSERYMGLWTCLQEADPVFWASSPLPPRLADGALRQARSSFLIHTSHNQLCRGKRPSIQRSRVRVRNCPLSCRVCERGD